MNLLIPLLAGIVAGGSGIGAVLWLRRRTAPGGQPAADGPPVLEWILRANGASGAWLVGSGTREVVVPQGGLSEALDRNIRARLEHQRAGDGQGIERLDSGVLVYASLDGRAAGLHLSAECSTGARATALRDLARFLDYERLRPILSEVVKEEGTPGETPESVAFRLAHQLERLLGVETCVALSRPVGVEITGVSLRSDRRLLRNLVEHGSPLEHVALGRAAAEAGVVGPFGSVVADRRKRTDPAFVCPIPGVTKPLGAVAVWTPDGAEPGGPALAGFRNALANVSAPLQRALDRAALSDEAIRDPLTRLLNRRGLAQVMTTIANQIGSLVYADIDHFKRLNDTLGHPAGDAALVHVSRILMQAVRDEDTVARIGGEEFAIWMPGATLERGRQVAERVRQAIAWSDWKWQGEAWPLKASFGVAACPETSVTREGLAVQADRALYQAKRDGRNRVAIAT